MDSTLGEYITKEYGLLKQILSYLRPCDLHQARFVCREWRKVVDNITNKNPVIISYQNEEIPRRTKPFLPDVVIYQNIMIPTKNNIIKEFRGKKCGVCKAGLLLCLCEVAGPETSVLFLLNPNITSINTYECNLYPFWQFPIVFGFSCSKNIEISTCYLDGTKKTLPVVKLSNHGSLIEEPIKAVFAIAKGSGRSATEKLLNQVMDMQGPTFAVGGGTSDAFFCKNLDFTTNKWATGFYIVFRGDDVSAHSELVTGKDGASIEKSMKELKRRAGEVPEGGSRIAFIAQCIDRRDPMLEKLELGLFEKYFPHVPQCGFTAYGEFGIKSGTSVDTESRNRNKRKKLHFWHAYTTSILIVTLGKA